MSNVDPTKPMLDIRDLHVAFNTLSGTVRAVNGVSLQVRSGEIVGLVGESGCGKSITARSVLRLVPTPPAVYEGGEIWVRTRDGAEQDVLKLDQDSWRMRQIRGRDISMIFQEPMRSLHPMMTIGRQIAEAVMQHEAISAREAAAKTEEMLDLVGLPNPQSLLTRYAHELSGGMRQRVMIALALICRPQLLIADEPTTALDVTIQAQILDLIRDLRKRLGMSVLLITHNMGVVASMADRLSVMYLGQIVETGTAEEVFGSPSHPYTQGLLASIPSLFSEPQTTLHSLSGTVPELAAAPKGCVFADRCPHVMNICSQNPPVVPLSVEHAAKCWLYSSEVKRAGVRIAPAAHEPSPQPTAIQTASSASATTPPSDGQHNGDLQVQVTDLRLHYPVYKGVFRKRVGTVRAVDGIELHIGVGETLGLVGESGCGKTTAGRIIMRLLTPGNGKILFREDGSLVDVTEMSQKDLKSVRRHMGMIFQDPMSSLNPMKNVRNIVGEPLMLHGLAHGKELDRRVGELLQMVGLRAEHQSRFPHSFSGGQRQRIAIARALALEPRFIVADEPVSALDVSVQAQVLNLLLELQQRLNLSMLFIAHDIAVVRHVSDRMAVMYLGKIVELASTKEVCSHPVHPYTEALLAAIPMPDPRVQSAHAAALGELPDPGKPPKGCSFHTRCRYSREICEHEAPSLRPCAGDPNHLGACHFQDELKLTGVDALARIAPEKSH